jgi:hypothetical protein
MAPVVLRTMARASLSGRTFIVDGAGRRPVLLRLLDSVLPAVTVIPANEFFSFRQIG